MAVAQTIQELTGNKYSELSYKQSSVAVKGNFISEVKRMLNKCDINIKTSGKVFDLELEQAIQKFQSTMGMTPTGILDNKTWQTMILYSNKYSDAVVDDDLEEAIASGEVSDSPHFNSFFGTSNMKTHRRNHKDIKIVLGNNTVIKTIKDVFMRSVSVEVDTSGNPVSETYEFIARDIVESDEIMDSNKYLTDDDKAPSDIKYTYPYFNN